MAVKHAMHERTTVNSGQLTSVILRNGILGAFLVKRLLLRARVEGLEDYDALAQFSVTLCEADGAKPLLSAEANAINFNYEAIPPPRFGEGEEDEEEEFDPTLWLVPYVLPPEKALRLLIQAREFPPEIKGPITFYVILDGYKEIEL